MMQHLRNIYRLGIKELRSLWHDKVMIILIVYSFSIGIYVGATATSTELRNVPVAFVDADRSVLSGRIVDAFYGPRFQTPQYISRSEVDPGMDAGRYTFVLNIPSGFEKELLAGKQPSIQVNIDAMRMAQAGIGAGYIQQMITNEVSDFLSGSHGGRLPVELAIRMKYNPNLTSSWFGGVMEIINNISMLAIILAGASLIREREHGTLEHLMVMPLNPLEIMLAKVWSMAVVVLAATAFALYVVLQEILKVPVEGSTLLFLFGGFLMLFSTTSMGIFMGTVARSMPQFGLILILTLLPLMVLSGTITPFESMPFMVQQIMHLLPTSHFVSMAQAVLYRGAGFDLVWPDMLAILGIGVIFFTLTLILFRRSLASGS
ncbi:ABC transporter permease [Sulfurimonas sp. HSL3-7]|uniref:ABC transporter permease n=1 Tax=Sulfonitrofixus jiaomeiensis TaxID=3131938 RepID=UPI0031F79E5A